ncbi:hypothetical protein M758_6G207200 [Ceratodon purpureus]|nr:hypothetical protein M758_6G207200 [Ceratodon purpureus]
MCIYAWTLSGDTTSIIPQAGRQAGRARSGVEWTWSVRIIIYGLGDITSVVVHVG